MRIGELARRSGLSVPAIRYYESRGLLPRAPRTPSGYRQYVTADIGRLKFIQSTRELGFTLKEIQQLSSLHAVAAELTQRTPLAPSKLTSIVSMLQAKRRDVEAKMVMLRTLSRELDRAVVELTCGPQAACPAARGRTSGTIA